MSIFPGLFRNFRRAQWTEKEEYPWLSHKCTLEEWDASEESQYLKKIQCCEATSLGGFRPGICPWTKCEFRPDECAVRFAEHNSSHLGTDLSLHQVPALQPRLKKATFNGVIRVAPNRLCFLFKDHSLFGIFTDINSKVNLGHFDLFAAEHQSRSKPLVVTQCEVSSDWRYCAVIGQTSTKGTLLRRQHYHTPSTYIAYILKAGSHGNEPLVFADIVHILPELASCSLYGLRFSFVPALHTQAYIITNLAQVASDSGIEVCHLAMFDLNSHKVVKSIPDLQLQQVKKLWRIQNLVYAQDAHLLVLCLESAHEAFNKKVRFLTVDLNKMKVIQVITHDLLVDYWRTVNCMQCYINTYPAICASGDQMAVLCTQIEEHEEEEGLQEEAVQCVYVYELPVILLSLHSACKLVILSCTKSDELHRLPLPERLKIYLGMTPTFR